MPNNAPDLKPRKVETKEKKIKKIQYSLGKIQEDFDKNIANIESKFEIADSLKAGKMTSAEDIWRTQIVFLDSVLDFYVHEITKFGITKILYDEWEETREFANFRISMRFVKKLVQSPENINLFLGELEKATQRNCFMHYEHLSRQLELLGVAVDLSSYERDINKLYKRRNEIAHQADITNGKKNLIKEEDVKSFISVVKSVQKQIQQTIVNKG